MLLFLSACGTLPGGPRLSRANVRQLADAKIRRSTKIDLRQYEISLLQYNPKGAYWSVSYSLKASRRVAFTIKVPDKIQKASDDESSAGAFEGALTEKADFH